MKRNLAQLALVLFLLGIACNFPTVVSMVEPSIETPSAGVPQQLPTYTQQQILYVTVGPPDQSTPTPFMPLAPTEIVYEPTPTATPPWGAYPGPIAYSDVPIPPPVEAFTQPAGQMNILLLGSDLRAGDVGYRTDTMLLVTVSPNLGVLSITSFPRDLYVYIPGWTMQRINTAHFRGGFELSSAMYAYNFGVKPDYYVLVHFDGFQNIVDSLGGINVQVGRTLTDHRDGYGQYTVNAGTVLMDGETALWYVRSRTGSNDFDRTRRQQEVLLAMFYRLISLNALQRANELFDQYKRNVDTNVTLDALLPYVGLAAKIGNDPSLISRYAISSNHVIPYRVPSSGAQVLLPHRDLVLEVMRQALHAP